jgi:hypothetical protein
MFNNNQFPQSVELGLLYERVGKGGTKYICGRLGRARISLLPGPPIADGTPTWRLSLQQAPEPGNNNSVPPAPPRKPPPASPRLRRKNLATSRASDNGRTLANDDVSDLWPE